MIWEIINEKEDQDFIRIVDNVMQQVRRDSWREDPNLSDDIEDAWHRVKELAQKGLIAEKHLRKWSKRK